jgi:hypothetical protein
VKKVIQISFAIVYLFLTAGFTITVHYCGGMLSDVSIVRTYGDKDPCGCDASCGDSCCNDEVHTIKIADSHKSEVKFNQNSFELVVTLFHLENYSPFNNANTEFSSNHFSGDTGPPSLYLYNCTFLI